MLAPLRLIKKKRLCTIVRRKKRIRVSYRQFFPVWVDGPRPVHARRIRAFNMRRGCSAAYALCLPCASAWKRRLLDSRLGSCRADRCFFFRTAAVSFPSCYSLMITAEAGQEWNRGRRCLLRYFLDSLIRCDQVQGHQTFVTPSAVLDQVTDRCCSE